MNNSIELEQIWKNNYLHIIKLIYPVVFVAIVLYILVCLFNHIFLFGIAPFYLLVCAVSKECWWLSDFVTSKTVGYNVFMGYLWSNISKPYNLIIKLKMYPFSFLILRPPYPCRVRRLSRNKNEVVLSD